jgi:hypothetical protein
MYPTLSTTFDMTMHYLDRAFDEHLYIVYLCVSSMTHNRDGFCSGVEKKREPRREERQVPDV